MRSGSPTAAVPVTPEISGYYGLYEWFMGAEPPAKDTIGLLMPNYTFLAANLQATGPNLTPETLPRRAVRRQRNDAGADPAAVDLRNDKGSGPRPTTTASTTRR